MSRSIINQDFCVSELLPRALPNFSIKEICIGLLCTLGIILAPNAEAQEWPNRRLNAVVPAGAGSTADIVLRVVLEQLAPQLKQPIIIENHPGAGGVVGANFVARSAPDGYTILVNSSAHTILPSVYPRQSYDPVRDFAAVVPLGISPAVLVVSSARGLKTVSELVAAAKANPGVLNFSSVGLGSATHLSAERFCLSAGIRAVYVPFNSGPAALSEVLAGRIDFFFGPLALVLAHVNDGTLLALAVNGEKRAAALPDVPTTLEAGFADAEYPIWYGLFVPAKTPKHIIDTLHRETVLVLQRPPVREKLAALGFEPMSLTPSEFDDRIQKELVINAALAEAVGIRPR